jgi:hypothetical protein
VLVVARTLGECLNACTGKLDLGFAAQRIFLQDGSEIFTDLEVSMLPRDADIFVSAGEPFKRVMSSAMRLPRAITKRVAWTSTGIRFPDTLSHGQTKGARDPTSAPLQTRPKVLVFKNDEGRAGEGKLVLILPSSSSGGGGGSSTAGVDADANPDPDGSIARDFCDRCTGALGTAGPVTRLFVLNTVGGGVAFIEASNDITALQRLVDPRLEVLLGRNVAGPCWASDGPRLKENGMFLFLKHWRSEAKRMIKEAKASLKAAKGQMHEPSLRHDVDVVFVVSLVASMGPALRQVQQVEAFARALTKQANASSVRVATVGFRDVGCLHPLQQFEVQDFTSDLGKATRFLAQLRPEGGEENGGDPRADVMGALEIAGQLRWRRGATRVAVVLTDAPAHGWEFDPTSQRQAGALREVSGTRTVTLRNEYGGTARYVGAKDVLPGLFAADIHVHGIQFAPATTLMYEKLTSFQTSLYSADGGDGGAEGWASPAQQRWGAVRNKALARFADTRDVTEKALNEYAEQVGNGTFRVHPVASEPSGIRQAMVGAVAGSIGNTQFGAFVTRIETLAAAKQAVDELIEKNFPDGEPQFDSASTGFTRPAATGQRGGSAGLAAGALPTKLAKGTRQYNFKHNFSQKGVAKKCASGECPYTGATEAKASNGDGRFCCVRCRDDPEGTANAGHSKRCGRTVAQGLVRCVVHACTVAPVPSDLAHSPDLGAWLVPVAALVHHACWSTTCVAALVHHVRGNGSLARQCASPH